VKLVYYCPGSVGGISDYAYAQSAALAQAGVEVILLTVATGAPQSKGFSCISCLEDESQPVSSSSRILRRAGQCGRIRRNIFRLCTYVRSHQIQHVILASYSEYFAPMWSYQLRGLARSGVHLSAILHDPLRNYVVGPRWWHNWSVRSGYSFLSDVFVHEEVDRAEISVPDHIRLSVVPHGPFDFCPPVESREEIRLRLGIPAGAWLLLSFGQIRDGKNLDRVIRAMRDFDELWLLVAGKEVGGVQHPLSYYQSIAEECGVANRCRWISDYIPSEQVGSLFAASDLVLLTYSSSFRSASGVLNAAVQFGKPCLVSAGRGALRTQVQKYHLGIWVEPDDDKAIRAGLHQFLQVGAPDPLHVEYAGENSWQRNAEMVRDRLFSYHDP